MFTIDVMSRVPVYEQLIKQVEDQVLKGIMKEGDKMPSVRSLSMELSTNPNTIQKAYMELDRRGILVSVPGKGSFISAEALKIVGNQSKEKLSDLKEIVRMPQSLNFIPVIRFIWFSSSTSEYFSSSCSLKNFLESPYTVHQNTISSTIFLYLSSFKCSPNKGKNFP